MNTLFTTMSKTSFEIDAFKNSLPESMSSVEKHKQTLAFINQLSKDNQDKHEQVLAQMAADHEQKMKELHEKTNAKTSSIFSAMDDHKNGKISVAELIEAMKARQTALAQGN